MAIDGAMRKKMAAGMTLVATYKKTEHRAEVIEGEEGKLRFRLEDGREFTSPSAAASAVMGGIAANGWRFWSIATESTEAKPVKAPGGRRASRKAGQQPEAKEAGSVEDATTIDEPAVVSDD